MLLLLLHMSLLPAYLLCTTGSRVMAMHLTATNQRPFCLVRDNGYVSSCRSNNLRYHYLRTLLFLVITWTAHTLLNKHTSSICQSMYFHMRALRHARPALTEDTTTALMVKVVQSRLDYANSILFKTSLKISKSFKQPKHTGTHCSSKSLVNSSCISPTSLTLVTLILCFKYKLATITYKSCQ